MAMITAQTRYILPLFKSFDIDPILIHPAPGCRDERGPVRRAGAAARGPRLPLWRGVREGRAQAAADAATSPPAAHQPGAETHVRLVGAERGVAVLRGRCMCMLYCVCFSFFYRFTDTLPMYTNIVLLYA